MSRRALLLVVLLAGCSSPPAVEPCEAIAPSTLVTEVRPPDIVVDGGELVLHASRAEVWLHDGSGCHPLDLSAVRVGDRLGHDATEIATSYPAQAWPDTVVIDRT